MPESEITKKVTKVIKKADKLVQTLIKGASEVKEAIEDLKKETK